MELNARDWMLLIGSVLILAVILDAVRRTLRSRRDAVRVNIKRVPEGPDDDLNLYKELPNGGARVVHRDELVAAANASRAERAERAEAQRQEQRASASAAKAAAKAAPRPAARRDAKSPDPTVAPADTSRAARRGRAREEQAAIPDLFDDEVPLLDGFSADGFRDDLDAGLDVSASDTRADVQSPAAAEASDATAAAPASASSAARDEPTEVHLLHVTARSPDGFAGDDILHILLSCDMRFGDMNFFHRHAESAGRGAIEFSVANMVQPGVFDLDEMADFRTPGLIFFLTLPGPEDIHKAFDDMLATARYVAEHLGGDVLDETRSALTRQTLEHAKQKLHDFERRQLAQQSRR